MASSGKKSVMCLTGGQTKHSPQKQIVSRSGYKKKTGNICKTDHQHIQVKPKMKKVTDHQSTGVKSEVKNL